MAQNLFLSKQGRQDIQTIILVLCTRVNQPEERDWNKLVRFMWWLHKTQHGMMIFSAENGLTTFEWYIDASFSVHPNFRSYTGTSINAMVDQDI